MTATRTRSGPDDLLLRRLDRWRAAHPDVTIAPLGTSGAWQAVIPEPPDGATIITRTSLGGLLDRLEAVP